MHISKRVLALGMALIMSLALMACGGGGSPSSAAEPPPTQSQASSQGQGTPAQAEPVSAEPQTGDFINAVVTSDEGMDGIASRIIGLTMFFHGDTSNYAMPEISNVKVFIDGSPHDAPIAASFEPFYFEHGNSTIYNFGFTQDFTQKPAEYWIEFTFEGVSIRSFTSEWGADGTISPNNDNATVLLTPLSLKMSDGSPPPATSSEPPPAAPSGPGSAQPSPIDSGFVYWLDQSGNGYMLNGSVDLNPAHLVIPAEIEGKPVTIDFWAFVDKSNLVTLEISEGIKEIPRGAFSNNPNLTTVILPGSLVSIGEDAFSNCPNLQNITLPYTLTIAGSAFNNSPKVPPQESPPVVLQAPAPSGPAPGDIRNPMPLASGASHTASANTFYEIDITQANATVTISLTSANARTNFSLSRTGGTPRPISSSSASEGEVVVEARVMHTESRLLAGASGSGSAVIVYGLTAADKYIIEVHPITTGSYTITVTC
jgi:hypothetical protein